MLNRPRVTLQTLGSGALCELFDHEMEKVLANIDDLNTSPTAPRVVIIKVTIIPTPTRDGAVCNLEVSSKIAGFLPAQTMVYFSREEKNGPLIATQSDSRQIEMEFVGGLAKEGSESDAD